MITSISSEAQKIVDGNTYKKIKSVFIKIKKRFIGENKHETLLYFV